MAPRAYWKGYLKLSLVSCPIALNPAASSSERVSFRQINKQTNHRLRQQLVDDVTREPVDAADRGKGYEVAKNEYILIEDEELEALEVESNHTIEIDHFVPAAQIDKRYYDNPYYIVPNDKVGQEAFAVIRDAMKGKDMVALGRVVMAKRERVIALEPHGKGLIGTTLRYPYEVRNAEEYFEDIPDIKVPGEMLKLAEHILETKSGDFDPSQFKDHYEEALVELLRKKQAHIPVKKGKEEFVAPPNVINLMDALRRSVQAGRAAPPTQQKRGRKRIEGQKEMLLPIEGKQAARDVPKKAAKPSRPVRAEEEAGARAVSKRRSSR
jgi:DNA end-binding protein Ku